MEVYLHHDIPQQNLSPHHPSFTIIQIVIPVADDDELKLEDDVGELSAITGSHLGSCGLHCCSWQLNILSFPVSSYPVWQEALYSDRLKDVWWRATVFVSGISSVMHDSTRTKQQHVSRRCSWLKQTRGCSTTPCKPCTKVLCGGTEPNIITISEYSDSKFDQPNIFIFYVCKTRNSSFTILLYDMTPVGSSPYHSWRLV